MDIDAKIEELLAVVASKKEKIAEQRSLDELGAKLNLLVSPEQRRAMELDLIMKQLGQ